jgi:hypothetical protein
MPNTLRLTLGGFMHLQLVSGVSLVVISLLASRDFDEDAFTRAAGVWRQMAKDLDGSVTTLEDLPEEAKRGWIAVDQEEFARVTKDMRVKTEELRALFLEIATICDEIADAVEDFFHKLNFFSAWLLLQTGYLTAMMLVPQTIVQARFYLRWLAKVTDRRVAMMILKLLLYVKAQWNSVATMRLQPRMFEEFVNFRAGVVDFADVSIDTRHNPTFQQPKPGEKLPDQAEDFNWVAPAEQQ